MYRDCLRRRYEKLITFLEELDVIQDFLEPVDWIGQNLPYYREIVKKPMSVFQIKDKFNQAKYNNFSQIVDDVYLIWSNCRLYNQANSTIVSYANKLERDFNKYLEANYPSLPIKREASTLPNHKAEKLTKSKKLDETSHHYNHLEIDDSPNQMPKMMTRRMARTINAKSIQNNKKITSFMKEKPSPHPKNDLAEISVIKDDKNLEELKNDSNERVEPAGIKKVSRSKVRTNNIKKQESQSDSEEFETTNLTKETKSFKEIRKKNSKSKNTHGSTTRGRSKPNLKKNNQNKNLKPISQAFLKKSNQNIDSSVSKEDSSNELQKVQNLNQSEDEAKQVTEELDDLNLKSHDISIENIVEKNLNENQDSTDIKLFTDEKDQTLLKFREVSITKVLRLKEMIRETSIEKLYKVIRYLKSKSKEHIQADGEFIVIQLEQLTYQIFNEIWNMIVGEELVDD